MADGKPEYFQHVRIMGERMPKAVSARSAAGRSAGGTVRSKTSVKTKPIVVEAASGRSAKPTAPRSSVTMEATRSVRSAATGKVDAVDKATPRATSKPVSVKVTSSTRAVGKVVAMTGTPARRTPTRAVEGKPTSSKSRATAPTAAKPAVRPQAPRPVTAKTRTDKPAAPSRASKRPTAAVDASRGVVRSSAKTGPAAKRVQSRSSAKSPARPQPEAKPQAETKPQRFTVSHLQESDFKADGLRPYARYRDLGIADATSGLCQAHVIRFVDPPNDLVRKRHQHTTELQLVYVLKGWVKNEFEGVGEQMMSAGSCWIQPSGIPHTVLDYSPDVELLEIVVPADFDTAEL